MIPLLLVTLVVRFAHLGKGFLLKGLFLAVGLQFSFKSFAPSFLLDVFCLKILGALSKLPKAYVSLVCPSVRTEQLGSHWTDFHKIWHLSIFRKPVQKIRVSLKSDKKDGYFT